ncbi:MAG TPA: DNA-processing protein DprA [Mycobacteriales bacterium]|nr:DNA-processing protein DprA [Mycobacteriales bacterium]
MSDGDVAGRGPDDERWARAALCRCTPPGEQRIAASLVDSGGAVTLRRLGAIRSGLLVPSEVDADLERLAALGGRLVIPGDDEWPLRVDELARETFVRAREIAQPYALWVRGPQHLAEVTDRSVAIVGMRASSPYGELVASELASGLAGRGWCVVSGGAFGIDAAAHRGSLAVGGPTVAVLAGGPDQLYPRSNEQLLERIVTSGLLVSELPPGFESRKERFLSRNRIVAALTRGTVVVEANLRSGALNTAAHARALARPVCAVPGRITGVESRGAHDLLRRHEGSRLVTSVDEVLEEVGPIGETLAFER